MSKREPYDIRKAPNVAPIINRRCGTLLAKLLDYYFEDSEAQPTEEEESAIKSFLAHLKDNIARVESRRRKENHAARRDN